MITPRLRRRARVLAGRGLRLLRTHFFSFVSACIIGGIFVYAMTSPSFSVDKAPAVHSAAAVDSATPVPMIYARPASIVYYIVSSNEQRQAIIAAMQGDQMFRGGVNARESPTRSASSSRVPPRTTRRSPGWSRACWRRRARTASGCESSISAAISTGYDDGLVTTGVVQGVFRLARFFLSSE